MRVIYIIYIYDQVSFILNYYEANCKLLFLWSTDVSVAKVFDFQSLSHRFNHRFTYIGFGNWIFSIDLTLRVYSEYTNFYPASDCFISITINRPLVYHINQDLLSCEWFRSDTVVTYDMKDTCQFTGLGIISSHIFPFTLYHRGMLKFFDAYVYRYYKNLGAVMNIKNGFNKTEWNVTMILNSSNWEL